jgi:hypothetical protein
MKTVIISTEFGNVDASSTAMLHGEGPNINGYRMTEQEATHTVKQANEEFGSYFGSMAESWAEGHYFAVALGKRGGSSTSEAKRKSSAANGKKGGRPRKA